MSDWRGGIPIDLAARTLPGAVLALAAALYAPSAAAQTAIAFSPDITVVLDGHTIDDQDAAEDDLSGNVTALDTGMLPANADLQAYHRTGDPDIGDLMVLDIATDLPGGPHVTPRKVFAFNNGAFSEVLDLAICGVPPGVRIDAMTATSEGAMWFSFDVPVRLGGRLYDDEDVVALSAGCAWQNVFDGSAAGIAANLDVDAIHFLEDSNLLLLSFDAAGSVGGVRFDDEDVVGYSLSTGQWGVVYDGSAEHPAGGWIAGDLDALDVRPTVPGEPIPGPEPPDARLLVNPQHLSFELSQDDDPASQSFTVQAIEGTIRYTILPGASWLSSNPTRGVSSGEEDTILAIVNPKGLAPGTYRRPLFINSGGGTIQLIVTLVVTPGAAPPGPGVEQNAAVNAASMIPSGLPGHAMSPQSAVAVFGVRFTEGEFLAQTFPLPLELGGVSITFNGIPAGLFYASPGQLIVQLPGAVLDSAAAESKPGRVAVQGEAAMIVTNAAGSSEPRTIQLDSYSPAIYTMTQTGSGQGAVLFSNTSDLAAPVGFLGNSRPAAEGDLLTIYANGMGPVQPPIADRLNSCGSSGRCAPDYSNVLLRTTTTRPVVTIGGVRVPDEDILFSGLSGVFVALNEMVFRLPTGVPAGNAVPIVIEIGGVASRGDVTIAVGNE